MSLSAATSYATLVRVTSKPVGDLVPPSSPTQRLTKYATVTLAAQRWSPSVKPNAADAESPGPGGQSPVPPTTPAKSPGGGGRFERNTLARNGRHGAWKIAKAGALERVANEPNG